MPTSDTVPPVDPPPVDGPPVDPPPVDPPPVDVFVAPDGNGFMRDIATWIVEAATELGRRARLVDDRLPADDGHTNLVVAPHEFYLLRDDPDARIREAARHSVPVCTEQPGTPWFLLSLGFCVGSPLVADINAVGLAAIEAQGFRARRLRLGGVGSLDHRDRVPGRDVDVLFLGGHTDRRAAVLAGLGPHLWDRRTELRMFSTARPIHGDEAGIVLGDAKYELLARSKVLVNLHRDDGEHGYFEWARMVEAMANGCVVVTEPSLGHEPLVAGRHFVEAGPDDLADTVLALLADDEERARIAERAHRAVQVEHPLRESLADLLADAEAPSPDRPTLRRRLAEAGTRRRARRPIQRDHRPPLLAAFTPNRDLRRRAYRALVAEMDLRREIGHLRALVERDGDVAVERHETPAYAASAGTTPEVSVVVTVHNYAHLVTETLDSIAASRDVDLEIVIVDDASTDDGPAVVAAWLDAHPDVAAVLLASPVNRGLPETRNLAFRESRADRVMVMDADNLVYPTALRRLADALADDPDAAFAYATLEDFGARAGLRSAWGWHVPWLCDANYIDAQAMLRRSTWERHGGYRDYEGTHGWEDWDLWLRIAAAGEHGVHVPQILGRYRTQPASMVTITNLAADDLRADLVARYPDLPWPELTGSGR